MGFGESAMVKAKLSSPVTEKLRLDDWSLDNAVIIITNYTLLFANIDPIYILPPNSHLAIERCTRSPLSLVHRKYALLCLPDTSVVLPLGQGKYKRAIRTKGGTTERLRSTAANFLLINIICPTVIGLRI